MSRINSSKTKALFFNSPCAGSFNLHIKISGYSIDVVDSIQCLGVSVANLRPYIDNVSAKVCVEVFSPRPDCNLNRLVGDG